MTEQMGVQQIPDNKQIQSKTPRTHLYLVFIWGAVSAETHGPYASLEARDQAALAIMDGDSEDNSVHTLDITTAFNGQVSVDVGDYGSDFFDNDEDADEVED